MRFEILVRLIVPDPWSFTVLDTLRRKFGLTEIEEATRFRTWLLSLDTPRESSAKAIIDRLLGETALLANPNRDMWFVRSPHEMIPDSFWRRSISGSEVFVIRVIDIDDIIGRARQEVVRQRLGITEIKSITFSTLWMLEIAGDSKRARRIAEEVAVARRWRKGLLANPHSQKALVGSLDEYLEGLLDERAQA